MTEKVAEKSNNPPDAGVQSEPGSIPGDAVRVTGGTDGHMRSINVNGVCYCQMSCGGQWLYFYKVINGNRVYLQCGQPGWTVPCAGNSWILRC
jgi:hypothetical protein